MEKSLPVVVVPAGSARGEHVQPEGRIAWLDVATVVAGYAEVVSNCLAVMKMLSNSGQDVNALAIVTRPAIALMFMLSGYKWLHRADPLPKYLNGRLLKTLAPLVFWSSVVLALKARADRSTFAHALSVMLNTVAAPHFWLCYALLAVYLAVPLLRLAVQKMADPRTLLFVVVLWLISNPLQESLNRKLTMPSLTPLQHVGFPNRLMGFFLAGGLLRFYPTLSSEQLASAWIVALGTSANMIYDAWVAHADETSLTPEIFANPQSVFIALQTMAFFVLLRHYGQKSFIAGNPHVCALLKFLADHAWGVYVVHLLLLQLLGNAHVLPTTALNTNSALVAAGLIAFCLLIVAPLRRIPYLRHVVY